MVERLSPLLAALCFALAAVCIGLGLSVLAQPAHAQPRVCDVDLDGDIDKYDIKLITLARNTPAAPGDPRDADQNGTINVNDARFCALVCTRASCAEY